MMNWIENLPKKQHLLVNNQNERVAAVTELMPGRYVVKDIVTGDSDSLAAKDLEHAKQEAEIVLKGFWKSKIVLCQNTVKEMEEII